MLLAIAIATIMMVTPTVADESQLHPAVLEWDDIETINAHLDDAPMLPQVVPSKKDLTSIFPTPGDQGNQGSCTAWAVAYALKSSLETTKREWTVNTNTHNFSPSFVYNQLTSAGGGIHISDAMNLVKNTGVCSLNYFPYDESDYSTQPSSKVIAAANLYKASNWNTIEGVNTIKNYIACGAGVVIAIKVYPDFDNISSSNQIYDSSAGTSRGAHAICLIGYDDSKGAFKFINSWGTDWGLNGYGWISYDLVNSSAVNFYGVAVGYVMDTATDNYILGDINGDDIINNSDALLVLKHSSKLITLTDRQWALADVNGDAVVDSTDANLILQVASKSIDNFPIYE